MKKNAQHVPTLKSNFEKAYRLDTAEYFKEAIRKHNKKMKFREKLIDYTPPLKNNVLGGEKKKFNLLEFIKGLRP